MEESDEKFGYVTGREVKMGVNGGEGSGAPPWLPLTAGGSTG